MRFYSTVQVINKCHVLPLSSAVHARMQFDSLLNSSKEKGKRSSWCYSQNCAAYIYVTKLIFTS